MHIAFCFLATIPEPRTVKAHTHTACELVYYTEGAGEILIDTVKYAFDRNYFTLTPAGTNHTQWNTRPLEAVCIGFTESGLEQHQGCWHDADGSIRRLCERMMDEYTTARPGQAAVCTGLAYEITGMIERAVTAGQDGDGEHLVKRALNIIREKEGDISVENLSRLLYVSPDYLRHLIKDTTDRSPVKHIIETRINKARGLLTATDLLVSQIAEECGFSSVYYFSQLFKKVTSATPTAFRHKNRKA